MERWLRGHFSFEWVPCPHVGCPSISVSSSLGPFLYGVSLVSISDPIRSSFGPQSKISVKPQPQITRLDLTLQTLCFTLLFIAYWMCTLSGPCPCGFSSDVMHCPYTIGIQGHFCLTVKIALPMKLKIPVDFPLSWFYLFLIFSTVWYEWWCPHVIQLVAWDFYFYLHFYFSR